MCWDQLVPPFSPAIIPIKLGQGDRYVLAVVIDPDYVRRPVMLTQGNKIPVRIEGHSVPADWYRLRDLFTEQPPSSTHPSLPSPDPTIQLPEADLDHSDFAIRARLLLTGPRGRPQHITETARTATLATLNSNDAPLTGTDSALSELMHQTCPTGWSQRKWELHGHASTQQFNALWQGFQPDGISSRLASALAGRSDRCLTEARIHAELTPRTAHGDSLTIQLDALLTNPRRSHMAGGRSAAGPGRGGAYIRKKSRSKMAGLARPHHARRQKILVVKRGVSARPWAG